MLDTDDLSKLTDTVPLLATYSDLVPDPAKLRATLPGAQLILIDRHIGDPSGEASVLDIEPGADSVAELPGWLERKRAAGVEFLTSYSDRDTLPAIDALGDKGKCFRWVATLDGTSHIAGYTPLVSPAAIQTTGSTALDYHADLSLVFDGRWHPQPEGQHLKMARELARMLVQGAKAETSEVQRLARTLHVMP